MSTFSVVVAAQSRQWTWLAILLVAGLTGRYGVDLLYTFPQLTAVGMSPSVHVLVAFLAEVVIPPAIPAIAALVFAGLSLRAPRATQGAAPQQGQA